ncbi:metal ABC transporter substrate-binding protein [Agromyces seonyuensis]|uniref:Zinc ABC transporter solute-binding protein n=1 Tax=Agromyces seonyuensis TaxID=2662446 RepID=A0A6I4NUU5_9MICO|nr:metal ABC transporter substrate-binding protein [Agromyces seonyuensis]MWB98226.1 zinc ABC transporter solute-binding protein [Agromyces seonyuensis]
MNPQPEHARRPSRPRTGRVAKTGAVAALGVAGVLVLAGCAGGPAAGDDGSLQIVATTTQVGDFTSELVGDQAGITQLIQPGQSAHSFDPSAAQLAALASADALVVNGAGLETWIDDATSASGFDGVLIDASTGIELAETGESDHDHDHAEEVGHEGESDDAHAEDDHDHAEGNPHIWTSIENAETMVGNIAGGLGDLDGIDAAALETARADYLGLLDDLDSWADAAIDPVPVAERLLVTNHDAFTYFVDEFDITFVGSVIPSFDDNAEPSAAQIDALVAAIEQTGVQAVFSETSISPATAETIATEAGVAVYSGPDALYGDSLGEPGSDGATYLASQIHNITQIVGSWGASVPALPDSLAG